MKPARIDLVIGFGYRDLLKARDLFDQITSAEARILKDSQRQVAIAELGPSSVDFVVRLGQNLRILECPF